QAGKTELKIYNIKGQVVRHLLNDELGMGEHRLMWNSRDDRGRQLSSGIYFVRINCGNYHNTQKLILLK
ncbi:MAG: T9SS type A sorting domain-containing protein, partial [Candidatus Cloacimonetes bacterium]|nr:T9SS type A sorting domain-containing protein [Candidatus Cloacimonadota bacterium]